MSEAMRAPDHLLMGVPVVVVIDAQRDWVLAPERAGISEPAAVAPAIAGIVRLLAAARGAATPVVLCQEVHRRSTVDYGRELDHGAPLRCLEGDEATALLPELDPSDGDLVVVKRRCSAFFGTELDLLLRSLGATTLVLAGGLTDVCVHATFLDAFQHGFVVRVVEDACVGSSDRRHEAALDAMAFLHHGVRCSSAAVAAELAPRPAASGSSPPGTR